MRPEDLMDVRHVTVALVASVGLAMIPASASAQDNAGEARAAFQEGVRNFGQRHFAEALISFQRAYRVRPHPSVMVNIANCYLALEQPLEAISWFERYLHDAAQVTPEQRAQIEQTIASARDRLARLTIYTVPANLEVYLDGNPIGTSPLRGARDVAAGPHVLEARGPDRSSVQFQARLEPGRSVAVTLNLTTRQGYIGSAPPGANDAALAALAPSVTPLPTVTPPPAVTPPPTVTPPPPTVTPPPPAVVAPPVLVAPPPTVPPREGPVVREETHRTGGFAAAIVSGLVLTAAGAGVAIGVTLYNNQWIAEYNNYAAAFDYYRTRDAERALSYQAQGREHLRVIQQNETIATVGIVAGSIGAAFTLGSLLFWPSERVPPRGARLQLHVAPTTNGLLLGGTF